ncbi:MAG: hypothetical protein ACK5LC_05725 [Coprobacillaceae bacterium]
MDSIIDVLKRILLAIVMITVVNVFMNNMIAYSLFNIGFVTVFTIPGIIVLVFMIYFIR